MEKEFSSQNNYYLGLDVGTNSVGYAVTDEDYNLLKHKGTAMWGSHIFEEGKQAAERRSFRSARRRSDRKKQRVALVNGLFAAEIAKVDERFFIRRKESSLYREDVAASDSYLLFNDKDFTDEDYYNNYPTIYHLICELIESDKPHDVRLVYLACAYLIAHRGHFYSEIRKDNVEEILDFHHVYENFVNVYTDYFDEIPWNCDAESFSDILRTKTTVKDKEQLFLNLVNGVKKYKTEGEPLNKEGLIYLLSGGTYELDKLFTEIETEEKVSICLRKGEEEFEAVLEQAGDYAGLLTALRNVYDWATLTDVLHGCQYIAKGKVETYEQHQRDLKYLKGFIRKYLPNKYYEVFRDGSRADNYTAYSYNWKSVKNPSLKVTKASKEVFCDYLKKLIKDVAVNSEDEADYQDMKRRLELCTFMPKQTDTDNRVIPYQLNYYELNKILERAGSYLPFLNEQDADGYTPTQKLLSIMEFRVPYFVGPLCENSEHAWLQRKADGKIYPWNFEEKVDLEQSEEEFIRRMTNTCSYLAGEEVLPKESLLYSRFMVLNEINNLKINGTSIPVTHKQGIYKLFQQHRRVSVKDIREYLTVNNLLHREDELSGIDTTIHSSLKSYHDFQRLLTDKILTEEQVEEIIRRITYSEDKNRVVIWLQHNYPALSKEDIKYISKLKYKDFGRLSRKLLSELMGCDKSVGEEISIMRTLWETNNNLMQLLSEQYTFGEAIDDFNKDYYGEHERTLNTVMNEMYISNAVKRPIYRALDIVKDIYHVKGAAPKKIFVEMARGGGEKGKRTKSHRTQIEELYKNMNKNEIREISEQLDQKSDNELQSEALFLYFMQLGKCAYSGESIDINYLKTDRYNVDHIYPQAYVKDDSMDNKVLVLSEINGKKKDIYPIASEIRNKMTPYWRMLKNNRLISEEKFKRLTRNTPFSEQERSGFINRQLVETRQSTKALMTILQMYFPDTEIVYSKAGLVSEYRHEFGLLKCRSVNDLHHAKDAYLNIVVGNVYHCRFTKNFYIDQQYTLKTKPLFTHPVYSGNTMIWRGEEDIARVRKVMEKNNIHYTRYAFIRKGGFFDQMPLKAAEGLVPRKKGLDSTKYGGYNKTAAACFLLVKYKEKGKTDSCIMPVESMYYSKVFEDEKYAINYSVKTLETIWNKKGLITDVSFPLGLRPLKVNTMLSFDGYRACITGKANGGKIIGLYSMISLLIGSQWEAYIKKIERFTEKKAQNSKIILNKEYDGITREHNEKLYRLLTEKIANGIYKTAFNAASDCLNQNGDKFSKLSEDEQIILLQEIISLIKTSKGCDLSLIGGSKNSGTYLISPKISSWRKKFSTVQIIDTSASGIYETTSVNLLEL